MQQWPGVPDLSARIAEVQAVGAVFEDVRHELAVVGGGVEDIAAETRWQSEAMHAYRASVNDRRGEIVALSAALAVACDEMRALAAEILTLDLQRSTAPGMAAVR